MTDKRLESYSGDEFARALARHSKVLLAPSALTPKEYPQAVLLGGQSGAGKTTLHRLFRDELQGNVVVINGDESRKSHPRFALLQEKYGKEAVEYTAKWAGKMTEGLIDGLSRLGYNLVIEGTLSTSEVPLKTARLLRERGYSVSLALMAVKPEVSLVSCQIRYEEMRIAGTTPRATDPAHHQKIVRDIVGNLKTLEESGLFERIFLYTRSEECLYPKEGAVASDVLEERLFGAWSTEEQGHYGHLKNKLEELKEQG